MEISKHKNQGRDEQTSNRGNFLQSVLLDLQISFWNADFANCFSVHVSLPWLCQLAPGININKALARALSFGMETSDFQAENMSLL